MADVQREIDRTLTHLRNKIREKDLSQLAVQEALGWGRSYISQLVTRQKTLRVEQILLILEVLGVEPAEFWNELYPPSTPRVSTQATELARLEARFRGLVDLLAEKGVLVEGELPEIP